MPGPSWLRRTLIWGLSRPLVCSLVSPLTGEQVSIFMLHRLHAPAAGIFGHTPEFLRAMLEVLRRDGYEPVSLARIVARITGEDTTPLRKAVAFTLDDGYADQGDMASEIFHRYDCPVTFFLISGFIDGTLWPWDAKVRHLLFTTRLSELVLHVDGEPLELDLRGASAKRQAARRLLAECKRRPQPDCDAMVRQLEERADVALPRQAPSPFAPLTWDRVRDLESKGASFAPHSVTHTSLARLSESEARSEIESSWARLTGQLAKPLPVFAYPSGVFGHDFGEREIELVRQAGLLAAFSADAGTLVPRVVATTTHRWCLPRFSLPEDMADVLQCASWMERAKSVMRRRWAGAAGAGLGWAGTLAYFEGEISR